MRAVIRYSRSGPAKWVSHLDMQRAFSRALRRSGAPVMYSQGFNPHMLMSFASPLSVGFATNSDYLEVKLCEKANGKGFKAALNDALPNDIRATQVFEIADNTKKLMALNHSASYEVRFNFENSKLYDKIENNLSKIMTSGEYLIVDRKGREKDIRAMISNADIKGGLLKCTLANSSSLSLNPALLAAALNGGEPVNADFLRTECFCDIAGQILPFHMLKI